jgi:arginine utilization protein RocB
MIKSMKRVVLLHGNGNSHGTDNWFPYIKSALEELDIECVAPDIDKLTQGLDPDELQALLLSKFMESTRTEGVNKTKEQEYEKMDAVLVDARQSLNEIVNDVVKLTLMRCGLVLISYNTPYQARNYRMRVAETTSNQIE